MATCKDKKAEENVGLQGNFGSVFNICYWKFQKEINLQHQFLVSFKSGRKVAVCILSPSPYMMINEHSWQEPRGEPSIRKNTLERNAHSLSLMARNLQDVAYEFLNLLRVYKDGHVERLIGTDVVPPSTDPHSPVFSKDIIIIPEHKISARLYLPSIAGGFKRRLPILLYFHGGAFCVSSPFTHNYHNYLNSLVVKAQIIAISINYRKAPENPLPAAYEDSWAALQWVASHRNGEGPEVWLNRYLDFDRVFLPERAPERTLHIICQCGSVLIPVGT